MAFLTRLPAPPLPLPPSNTLRWLILCVSLTKLRDAQMAGKSLFMDVCLRVSLREGST